MRRLHFQLLLASLLAGVLCITGARADMYTWTDESGRINISNLPPPEGVKVIKVVKDAPAPKPSPAQEAREAALRQAEIEALNSRVRQLQEQVDLARTLPPAPPVVYPIVITTPAPQPQYIVYEAPQPAPVQYAAPAPAYTGCDFGWSSCLGWWGTTYYPSNVVVAKDRKFPRFQPLQGVYPIYGGNRIPGAHTQPIANGPGFNGPGPRGPGGGGEGGGGTSRGGGRRG